MPQNVRNFWLEAHVDGSKTAIGTGPKNKDGGFSLTIKQRNDGDIVTSCRVNGRVTSDGRIILEVEVPANKPITPHVIATYTTIR